MPVYIVDAVAKDGTKVKEEIEAKDERAASLIVRRRGLAVRRVRRKPKDLAEIIPILKPRVKTKEVVIFTRQLSTMIDAGLPLVQALDALASQQDNPTFKELLTKVKQDVESGSTFAEALRKFPKQFDQLYCNMVAAGEVGGVLDVVLRRLAEYMEKAQRLKRKVKGAMAYPAVVLAISIIVLAIILIWVIPTFQQIFEEGGQALPLPTQIVINLSQFVRSYFLAIVTFFVILALGLKQLYRTEKGALFFDRLFLKAPVFGVLLKKVAVAKFTRTLGTLIESGVAILDALNVASGTAGNKVVEKTIERVKVSISEGRTIAQPLGESGIFPPMVVQMISVGETTGSLSEMLNKIADFYDEEVDTAVEALTSMLEPLMIVFLGGTIGSIIIAMYLPIFKMPGAVGG